MKIEVVLSVIVSMAAYVKGESLKVGACAHADNHILTYNFTDQMREDHVIYQFSDEIRLKKCSDQPFMKVENNSVLLTRDLRTVCKNVIECTFTCENKTNTDIFIRGIIERFEPYTFKFYHPTYQTEVRELTPIYTRLSIHPSIDVLIEECEENATSLNMFFDLIQDGNGTFVWKTKTSNNGLFLAEEIDYERNTFYTLEVVYKSMELNGNATAKIHVTVIDVDDEDPVFDAPVYTLRPREGDKATLDTWLETTPKIFAYDQDFGINVSVVYTIHNESEPGLFKIDNTTGLMSISRILDREQTASYSIVIMASQTDDIRRTATASVVVHVMDTDDNPPTFHQRNYNVNLTDHAIAGTVVAMVKAVDIDEGINAKFTYALCEEPLPVSIDPYTGVIRVTNSEMISKKLYKDGMFTFQVGTKPADPNGLSGNTATVNVNIIETDRDDGKMVPTDANGDFGGSEIGLIVLSTIILIGGIITGFLFRKVMQNKVLSSRMNRSSREIHPAGESHDQTEMAFVGRLHIADDHIKDIQGFATNQRARNIHNTSNNARVETILGPPKCKSVKQPNIRGSYDVTEPVKNDRSKIKNVPRDKSITDKLNMDIQDTSSSGCESETNTSSEPESDGQDIDSLTSQENHSDDTESIVEEPAVDYTTKSVRISNEVLDLEKNTILPINTPISTDETYRGLNETHNRVHGIKQKYRPIMRQADKARVQQYTGGLVLEDTHPGRKASTHEIISHNKGNDNAKHAKLTIQVTNNDKGHGGEKCKTQTVATNHSPEADTFMSGHTTRNHVEKRGEELPYNIKRYERHDFDLDLGEEEHDTDRLQEGGEETENYTSHGSGLQEDIDAIHDNGLQECGREIERYASNDSDLELVDVNNGDPSYAIIRYLSSEDEISFPVDKIDESVSDTSEENSQRHYQSLVIQGSMVIDV